MDAPLLLAPVMVGALFAWSLAATPGPGNALIAQEAARRGVLAGMTTGAGAIAADFAMFLLMWLGVLRVLVALPWLQVAFGAAGSVVLVVFARDAWRAARQPTLEASGRGSFARSFVAIVTSPLNHVWWTTVGTTFLANTGLLAMAGFFGGLALWVALWSALARFGAARVRRFAELVAYASAIVLLVFAVVVALFTVRTATGLLA